MREELQLFFVALSFLTRLPIPRWVEYTPEALNQAARYFPFVGWIVGGSGGLVYWLASGLWPETVALLLSMAATICLTGGFHEDGWADFCDGFGGGWTASDILRIMKDSRIGTFGTLGLALMLGGKWSALNALPALQVPLVLWAGHSLSRALAVSFLWTHQYVREDAQSKAKPLAQTISLPALGVALGWGILPLCFFEDGRVWLTLIPLWLMRQWLGRYWMRWIGGYTGDCLGAAQQLSEVIFYLSWLALLSPKLLL